MECIHVTRSLAFMALMLISAPSLSTPAKAPSPTAKLSSTAPWWERVTVTIAGDGNSHSCKYESSVLQANARNCDVEADAAALGADAPTAKDQLTRLTFERRFSPGAEVSIASGVAPGDTLLGRQVMALAIDAAGAVKGCRVVARSGDMTPAYGCKDAAAERFEASAAKTGAAAREGVMTVLVYGHEEHLV
jgi:hypothetical protein